MRVPAVRRKGHPHGGTTLQSGEVPEMRGRHDPRLATRHRCSCATRVRRVSNEYREDDEPHAGHSQHAFMITGLVLVMMLVVEYVNVLTRDPALVAGEEGAGRGEAAAEGAGGRCCHEARFRTRTLEALGPVAGRGPRSVFYVITQDATARL